MFCHDPSSLLLLPQLNIRKLLDEAGLPPINIICQKVANQGLTRFEDRRRLPLGISVNFNSMAAKLLTQVRRGEGGGAAARQQLELHTV